MDFNRSRRTRGDLGREKLPDEGDDVARSERDDRFEGGTPCLLALYMGSPPCRAGEPLSVSK